MRQGRHLAGYDPFSKVEVFSYLRPNIGRFERRTIPPRQRVGTRDRLRNEHARRCELMPQRLDYEQAHPDPRYDTIEPQRANEFTSDAMRAPGKLSKQDK